MKGKLIKILSLVFISIAITILCPIISNANTINKIQKVIYINEDGSAKVAEIWDAKMDSKTEIYVPWDNLGNSTFKNLQVSDDRGITYETKTSWDANATFEQKKDKCGIHKTSEGIEVCWGISEYGKRKYKISYDITNFVEECQDSQYVYWQVFPKDFGLSVESIVVRIQSNKKFDENNSKIWAFGYPNGNIKFSEKGYIVMNSNGSLPSNNYMKALIKFENNDYTIENKNSKTFQEIYDKAMLGTENEKKDNNNYNYRKKMIPSSVIILIVIFIGYAIFSIIRWVNKPIKKSRIIFEEGKHVPSIKNISYVRDISQVGCEIDEAYYILQLYGILEEKDRSIIMGAILLKWIKRGLITITQAKSGILDFGKQKYCIDLSNLQAETIENTTEKELLKILKRAAEDDLLEPQEFKNYCKKHNRTVLNFFSDINSRIREELCEKKEIVNQRKQYKKHIRKIVETNTVYTYQLKEKAIKLLGLKKFLMDYSKIASREAVEVELWDEYLVYAQLLGIADKVEKQFKNIYPDYNQILDMNENLLSSVTCSYADAGLDMAEKWHRKELARQARRERWESLMSSSSSFGFSSYSYSGDSTRDHGGGGSSYSGGGSGASGSSSGGGAR